MSKGLRQIISYSFFIALSIGVSWYVFSKVGFENILDELKEIRLVWIFLVLIVSLTGHFIRALRWQQLIQTTSNQPPIHTVFVALIAGYFVNLGIPRLGEVTRCISLNKLSKTPFAASIGTVVTERIIDVITLITLFIGVSWIQSDRLSKVYNQYVGKHLEHLLTHVTSSQHFILEVVISFFIFGVLIFLMRTRIKSWFDQLLQIAFIKNFKNGLLSILNVKQIGLFLFYTALIWCSYFLTSYVCFFALPKTAHLGISAGIAVTVYGSISRSLPAAGGSVGIYHALVAAVLILFGVDEEKGIALAVIIHGTQVLFYLITGTYAGIIIAISRRKAQPTSIQ